MKPEPGICDLCGLPLSHGIWTSVSSGKRLCFCCNGCKHVFHMLMEASPTLDPASFRETELYKKCQALGIIPASEDDLSKKTAAAQRLPKTSFGDGSGPARKDPDGPVGKRALNLSLSVQDMWCPACAWVIEEQLAKTRGMRNVSCNFSTDRLRCAYDPTQTSPDGIVRAVEDLGYRAFVPNNEASARQKKREFVRFAVSAFLTVNIMMLSLALYSGFFVAVSEETVYNLSWPIFVMTTVVLFYGGGRIYRRTISGLVSARFGMETLIAAGSLSAYLYSTFNLLFGSIHLYYDTAAMLITLVLLGKTIERRAMEEVQGELGDFYALKPTKVRLCSDVYPNGRYVSAEQLRTGDSFRVDENEIVPADGVILSGGGLVDESSLTGEAFPAAAKPGDRLRAGSRLVKGSLKVKAHGVAENSTLGQMIAIMEKALADKTPLEDKTDRALQWFVPLILLLALGTGVACRLAGLSMGHALIRAVTVMVISCPCALGIAIPLARVSGVSLARRAGILIRDFSAFEKAEQIDTVVFDKTGTVTEGRWALRKILPFKPFDESRILSLAAALELESDHTIALEIKRRAAEKAIPPVALKDVKMMENGISGHAPDGTVRIGSRRFVLQPGTRDHVAMPDVGEASEQSLVFMSCSGRPCALFVFGDKIKEDASFTVQRLLSMGLHVALISGDGHWSTKSIARKIGIDAFHGGNLPHEKASYVAARQRQGHRVAMVGDGINDGPALVQADLALAVHGTSPLGQETAHVTLMRGAPSQVLDFLALARRVNKKVHQNLTWAFLYNAVSIPLAMSGLLTPLIAVSAMLMSSLSVIGNSLLLIKQPKQCVTSY
jgi:heavy metal translocating P-type ATPase